ncbi:MAG: VanW family protein [Eubacteriales bacterium]|nr:VanW family protein [Eubacteriales bacterium]
MNRCKTILMMTLLAAVFFLAAGRQVKAAPDDVIQEGVTADGIDLSGMTQEQAQQAVSAYVESLRQVPVSLQSRDGASVSVTAGELGITWKNTGLVQEAAALGRKGNVVVRYKAMKDLKNKGANFPIELDFDREAIAQAVTERCSQFNAEAVDAHLKRENGGFVVEPGQTGYVVDEAASTDAVYNYLTQAWNREQGSVELVMAVDEPQGKAEDLEKVKDVLGTFTTSYTTSGASRSQNVANGCSLINGATIYPGEAFSTYDAVKPFSAENGYEMAGSYLNGKVVDSIGGGICQVSTTLYNAVLRAELEVTERHNHSMIVTYVDPSADAAIAESSGKDFVFVNNTEYPIYIEGYTQNKKITFTIYGVETRPKNRTVTYESEVLEKQVPEQDNIVADPSQPVGVISVSSAHIGYKARLWKVVREDGVEVSREQVNSSSYRMSPRTATVGTATADPNVSSMMDAAIASSSIDQVKSTIANIQAAQAAAAALTQEQLEAIAAAQAAAAQAALDAAAGN